jgi:hypothetical protein
MEVVMGIAGYNRGSQAIARQIREEYAKSRQAYYSTHELPAPKLPEPKMEGPELCANSLGYYTLTDPHSKMPEVGDRVFSTVTNFHGWHTITAVKGSRRDLRIKTEASGRMWGYGHNYTFCPPAWMVR